MILEFTASSDWIISAQISVFNMQNWKRILKARLLWKPNLTADLLKSSCFLTAIVFKMCNFHIYSFTYFCIYLKEVFSVWFIWELIGRVEDRVTGLHCNRKLYLEKIVRETNSHSNIECEADAEKKRNKTKSLSKRGKKLLHGKVKFMPHFLSYEFVRFKQFETENWNCAIKGVSLSRVGLISRYFLVLHYKTDPGPEPQSVSIDVSRPAGC